MIHFRTEQDKQKVNLEYIMLSKNKEMLKKDEGMSNRHEISWKKLSVAEAGII